MSITYDIENYKEENKEKEMRIGMENRNGRNILKNELAMVYRLNRNNLVNAKRIKSKINSELIQQFMLKKKLSTGMLARRCSASSVVPQD